ncbi:MAG: bifunctional folylpolyglutamate synthase/dihydrofolate synthase [Cyanobacteria bacterium RI_101]|nr:bifunctional folylpolyglutamate synthase/dihydrofolate synthase [Cyanobacteria bacterium RI_101]
MTSLTALLEPYQRSGINLGLTRIQALLARLGDPQRRVPIVHVAGSNGKGSVCAYLSSILTSAGYRVGRYTSPHLIHWTERLVLNEQPIPESRLIQLLEEITPQAPTGLPESPTLFEVMTAAAWLYFAQEEVDVAVMEVGLGGRLDATNVVDDPLVTVITSLSLEHRHILGPTLADIAGEKAGILKPGRPAILGVFPPEAETVVAERVQALNCPQVWVAPAQGFSQNGQDWAQWGDFVYPLPLPGRHQLINSSLALATVESLNQQGFLITPDAIQRGLAQTRWPGRLQWLGEDFLIDGAHNGAGAEVLAEYVRRWNRPVCWVMGMVKTKEPAEIFQALLHPGDRLFLTAVPDHASADPGELAALARELCPRLAQIETEEDLFTALDKAQKFSPPALVVLCGSLYLVGHYLQRAQNCGAV